MSEEPLDLQPEDQDQGPDVESGTEGSVDEAPAEGGASNWRTIGIVAIVGLVAVLALAVLFSSMAPGAEGDNTPTTEFNQPRIDLTDPVNGAVLDIAIPVTVSGTGAGLFEGSVVVQALDSNGKVLTAAATTIEAPDAGLGGEGPWSVQLKIDAEPGTPGQILALSMSPQDGSVVASDGVDVTFGATAPVVAFIEIAAPADGAVLDTAQPVAVSGSGGGLFEGNVVVQAVSSDGSILAETAATIQAPDAGTGGSGPWTASLKIDASLGSTGQITAFSPSPEDGSIMASDSINVAFGTAETPATDSPEPPGSSQVNLGDPHWETLLIGGTAVLGGTSIGADFGSDGQVTGSAGCNSYFAPYETSGNSLTIGQAGSTRLACSEPAGIMEQESAYLAILVSSATYEIVQTGGQLVIRDPSGSEILVYNAAVTGVVTYPPQTALPDDAVVIVQLRDVSLQDVPAEILGQDEIQTGGLQGPFAYVVLYDPTKIIPSNTYSMSARITDGAGNLLFISDTIFPVLTNGNPTHDVEIVAVPVN